MSLDNGWVPNTTKPFRSGDYLVYCPSSAVPRRIRHYDKTTTSWSEGAVVTHWQHLPFAPTGSGPALRATVGNGNNEDLEKAYKMGFLCARNIDVEDFEETQEYVDQRRSDLKELKTYDRSR